MQSLKENGPEVIIIRLLYITLYIECDCGRTQAFLFHCRPSTVNLIMGLQYPSWRIGGGKFTGIAHPTSAKNMAFKIKATILEC